MKRSFWIRAHLLAAAFFTPALLIIAASGGLYLLGIKGQITRTSIEVPPGTVLDLNSATLENDVRELLTDLSLHGDFEYVKVSGQNLVTRPTSRPHYEIKVSSTTVQVFHNNPSLQKTLVELHKGHGPLMFKDFQKVMAAALLFVILSGTWLGISSQGLRTTTMAAAGSGLAVLLALILAP